MRGGKLILGLAALLSSACPRTPAAVSGEGTAMHEKEIDDWHAKRIASLKKDHGWLTLSGLEWLDEGKNALGSKPDSAVPFPAGAPEKIGELLLEKDAVTLTLAVPATVAGAPKPAGASLALKSDGNGTLEPDKVELGSFAFTVIKRGKRHAVRIWNKDAKTRTDFHGIDRWPVSSRWRVDAKWAPYDPPKQIEVPTVIPGYLETSAVPGAAVFTIDGKEQRLDAILEEGDDSLFFIFGDPTNGKESYGGGRFLYADMPRDGKVVVDFNKSYNPPCVFTPFATCPLPPEGNRLPMRVDAGEKNYGGH